MGDGSTGQRRRQGPVMFALKECMIAHVHMRTESESVPFDNLFYPIFRAIYSRMIHFCIELCNDEH